MPRIRQVALIVDAARPSDRPIILGVAAYAREVGNWRLFVEEDPLRDLPDFNNWHGDGIIANFTVPRAAQALKRLKTPVVRVLGNEGAAVAVETDDEGIARMAAEHLITRGLRRLAYCGLPRSRANLWSLRRATAFKQRAAEAGLRCSVYTGRQATSRNWADLHRELASWLQSLERPFGLMACNDARGLHVLEACRTIGAGVPDDVAVIGVDNDELMCELSDPPLSSVQQGSQRIGYKAAELLDRWMAGKKPRQSRLVIEPDGVVVRRSTEAFLVPDAGVAQALRFIRDHACRPIRVRDVLSVVGGSRSTLDARFKSLLGRTIHAEIRRVQIERAQSLVASTDLPLKAVAGMAGFSSVQYLTTQFRQHVGQTPAEYRKLARG